MSFVEFDSSNALIRTILDEIDMITEKLDRRADQIINTYSPGKVNSRLRAMSPEIKNLRRRTIDLIKDGENVLNKMSRFETDDRSKYSVKDWMKNLNNETDLRRVLIDLRKKLRQHTDFLQSYFIPEVEQSRSRNKSRDTIKRTMRKTNSKSKSPNARRRNTQERFEKVEGQLKDILEKLSYINKPQ